MLADQIVRANRAADSLFGGPSVREFASCEFPREDLAWVATQTRPSRTPKVRSRSVWGRFWRAFGTPEEPESDTETVSDPASA
jgi:hypothetical protein